jgi:hypothetical protein
VRRAFRIFQSAPAHSYRHLIRCVQAAASTPIFVYCCTVYCFFVVVFFLSISPFFLPPVFFSPSVRITIATAEFMNVTGLRNRNVATSISLSLSFCHFFFLWIERE